MINNFHAYIREELAQLDELSQSKRRERVITKLKSPTKAVIGGRDITLFNTNDYLGLRLDKTVITADHQAVDQFGTGAGSVRFISGTTTVYKNLEQQIAHFHGYPDAILFSSAFMANLATMSVFAKDRQAGDCLLLTDEMNHRSIIDGIKLAAKDKADKQIYPHLDYSALERQLAAGQGQYRRAMIVTDGVFSMLGDMADIKRLNAIKERQQAHYPEGILLVVDDCHGVGVIGDHGRGVGSVYNSRPDLLVGTFGKAMGVDGGYVVGDEYCVDYLREKGASYIFSNSFSPGSAGASSQAVKLLQTAKGQKLIDQLQSNVELFQHLSRKKGLAVFSKLTHPIQPFVVGDSGRTVKLADQLFERHGFFVTPITFPAVAKGKEELRIQLNATHTQADIQGLVDALVALT